MIVLLLATARAYELNGHAWPPDEMPAEVHWTGEMPGLSQDELAESMEAAAAAWSEAGPCALSVVAVHDDDAAGHYAAGGFAVLFGDPEGDLDEGVLMATTSIGPSFGTVRWNGVVYERPLQTKVVFNDTSAWVTDAAIRAGECLDQFSIQGALTHEIGHVLGLDHPCDMGEVCTHMGAVEATMYWQQAECDLNSSELGSDDVDGLAAIYGDPPALAFTCAPSESDPLEANCTVTGPTDADSMAPTWDFGDGATGEGAEASHRYDEAGAFVVELCRWPPGCDEPRCREQSFTAGEAATEVEAPGEETCACAAGTAPAAWATLIPLLVAVTRRRRS